MHCHRCNGKGKLKHIEWCPVCRGKGQTGRGATQRPCRSCNGTGGIEGAPVDCARCNGTGQLDTGGTP